MPYLTLNERIPDLEWKIIDIGYMSMLGTVGDKLSRHRLVIRLRDRQYHNMLFVYNPFERYHDMEVIRKTKSYVEKYVINLKD
jgi:hypothetical protein